MAIAMANIVNKARGFLGNAFLSLAVLVFPEKERPALMWLLDNCDRLWWEHMMRGEVITGDMRLDAELHAKRIGGLPVEKDTVL